MESPSILFDRNITGLGNRIQELAPCKSFDGRRIIARDLEDSEILIVRSVTKVDKDLLNNSKVKLVCSATAGLDHVDIAYLRKSGINFFSTQGFNSRAVVEYTLASIFFYAASRGISPFDLKVGIVGYGNIGRELAKTLSQIGIQVLINDPPLQEQDSKAATFSTLAEIWDCDVVTLHVPLNEGGSFPTRDLIDEKTLKRLKKSALIINAARGGVINELGLLKVLKERNDLYIVLDCWSSEPRINSSLIQMVWRASPHIAGSSLNSREKAVFALADRVKNHLGLNRDGLNRDGMSNLKKNSIIIKEADNLVSLLRKVLPLDRMTAEMKQLKDDRDGSSIGIRFDKIRGKFSDRRDFCFYQLDTIPKEEQLFGMLGFRIKI